MLEHSGTDSPTTRPPEEYKIAVIGDTGSGKSSLVVRLCYEFFTQDSIQEFSTTDLHRKEIYLDGKQCVLVLIDTAYPEEGSKPIAESVEQSDAVVIAHSISRTPWRSTPLKVIRKYHEMVKVAKTGQSLALADYPVMILGTQDDRIEERVLDSEEVQSLARELGCLFAECSSLNGDVERPFYDLARSIRDTRLRSIEESRNTRKVGDEKKGVHLRGILDQLENFSQKAWVFG